jgi:hypothetical protein
MATAPTAATAATAATVDLTEPLPAALRGDEAAARSYARRWRRHVRDLLRDRPGAPASTPDVLDLVALTAPFDPAGPLHALVSAADAIIGGMTPPPATTPLELPDPLDYQRFTRVVLAELSGAGTGLERLLAAWELSVTGAAALFGVRRQAVQQWLAEGVPSARLPKLLVVLQIADLLERNLLPERVPAVVRTPADAYGGASILEMVAADRHVELRELVALSFDWAASA